MSDTKNGFFAVLSGMLGRKNKEAGACCGGESVNLEPVQNASCCAAPKAVIHPDDQFDIAEEEPSDLADEK